jgi:hypothetical protein
MNAVMASLMAVLAQGNAQVMQALFNVMGIARA